MQETFNKYTAYNYPKRNPVRTCHDPCPIQKFLGNMPRYVVDDWSHDVGWPMTREQSAGVECLTSHQPLQ